MEKNLYIDASHQSETRVVLKSKVGIEEYEYESKNKLHIKNNIYLGKISRIEPSLQAAFVDFGEKRHGFLAFNDIQTDYYQLPHDDKEKLKKQEESIREKIKDESEKIEEGNLENNSLKEKELENKNDNDNFEKTKIDNIKKQFGAKRYKIQEVIKPNQIVLIQILKEERGLKGAALTTFISLAGKYTVLMPNTPKGGGISRKIFNSDDRKKIRNILDQINIPKTMGLIVRTAGANKTKNEINNDINQILNLWEEIKVKAIDSIAPCLIHEEGDIIKRAIRDIYDNDTKNIIIEGNDGYQKAKKFMRIFMPKQTKFVKKYRGKTPLFHSENIEKDLNKIFEPVVRLKSGGYLVINPTEALVAIDVNSGQSTREVNIEKTALNTNVEAAEEIARQIKIRDLSGLLVIDFIDMLNFYNRRLVEKSLREKLKEDRARIQFGKISNFGLLEMTRQRLRESSVKWKITLSIDSFALKVVKKSEELAFSNKAKIVNINIPEKVKFYIENNLKNEISHFKKKYKLDFNLISDKSLVVPEYKIDLLNKNKKIIKKVYNIEEIEDNETKKNHIRKNFSNTKFNNNFKKRRFNKKFKYNPKKRKSNFVEKKTVNY